MQRDKKQSIINQLKVKFMNIDFEYEEDDIQSKGDAIIKALQELNFEERGHQIINYLDEYPSEIAVTNINVPSIADCREITYRFNVEFYTDFGMGVFEID